MPIDARPSSRPSRRRAVRGLALFEILLATAVLVIGFLGYVASIGTSQALGRSVEEKTVALKTLEAFVERLRADPTWGTLYDRLRAKSTESAADTGLTWRKSDPTLTTYPASAYFAGFTPPTTLGTVSFLVQVPRTVVGGVAALRENAVAPRYGLPADVDGDGVIDGDPHESDYVGLPVVVRVRWVRPGQQAQEIVVATWLSGERG